jgi:hypothetical protein
MLKELAQTYEKEIRSRTGSVGRLFPGLHYHVQWMTIVLAPVFIWISGASRLFVLLPIGVTGRLKTGHLWALQNRPLQGVLFISDFLTQARFFSIS